jgi:signal transduction histidine kinase
MGSNRTHADWGRLGGAEAVVGPGQVWTVERLRGLNEALVITGKARSELELRRSVERLELLAATAGELLQAPEPQQVVEALCTRVLKFLGCHVFFNYLVDEQAGALRLNAWAGIPAAEAARIGSLDFGVAVCGCAARERRRIVAESVQTTPDERTALVRSYGVRAYACHPLLGPGGAVIGTLSFGTRDRDRFDEEELSLMKAVADLVATAMTRVRDTRALRESRDQVERNLAELAAVNAELEAFVYSVSHDLREPLRTVSGYAQIVLAEQAGRLDERGAHCLQRIERGAARMNRLIEDLLHLSRISRHQLERVEVDLSAIAAVAELREADAGRSVEVEIAPGLTAVADRGLIEIALSNLLANAWKFTSRAGPARIRFGAGQREGRREFFVQDNGVGFDPAYAAQLFQPFHRLHAEREFPGTGIGLALVERVVRRHGGQVRAAGRPGAGAAFFFTLGDGR